MLLYSVDFRLFLDLILWWCLFSLCTLSRNPSSFSLCKLTRSKHMSAVDDVEQSEFGDVETHAIVADTPDFSPHQFIAPDEARGAMGSDDNEQDAAHSMLPGVPSLISSCPR